jgi:hypothetical protein
LLLAILLGAFIYTVLSPLLLFYTMPLVATLILSDYHRDLDASDDVDASAVDLAFF